MNDIESFIENFSTNLEATKEINDYMKNKLDNISANVSSLKSLHAHSIYNNFIA